MTNLSRRVGLAIGLIVLFSPAAALAQGGARTSTAQNAFTVGYAGKYFSGETFGGGGVTIKVPGEYYGGIDMGYYRRLQHDESSELSGMGHVQFCFHGDETALIVTGGVMYVRRVTVTIHVFVTAEAGIWHEGDSQFTTQFQGGVEVPIGGHDRLAVQGYGGIDTLFAKGTHSALRFGANLRYSF